MFDEKSQSSASDKVGSFRSKPTIKNALGDRPPNGMAAVEGEPAVGGVPAKDPSTAAAVMMAHWGEPSRAGGAHTGIPHLSSSAEALAGPAGQHSAPPSAIETRGALFTQPGTGWAAVGGAWAHSGLTGAAQGAAAAAETSPGAEPRSDRSAALRERAANTPKGDSGSSPGERAATEESLRVEPAAETRAGKGAAVKERPVEASNCHPESPPGEVAATKGAAIAGSEAPGLAGSAQVSAGGKDAAPGGGSDAGTNAAAAHHDHGQGTSARAAGGPDAMHAGGRSAGGGGAHAPNADPDFQAVKARAGTLAAGQSAHASAATKAGEAANAAASPPGELESQAEANHLSVIEQAQSKPFGRHEFKAALLDRIAQSVPKNLQEADNFKNNNRLGDVKDGLQQQVEKGKQEARSDIKQKTEQTPSLAGLRPKTPQPLAVANPASPSPAIGAAQAMPKPRSESAISMQTGPRAIEQQMAEAHVTEPQLQRSNESQFQAAVGAKQQLAQSSQTGPAAYRQTEQSALTQARVQAEGTAQAQTQGMQSQRGQALGQVTKQQGVAKSKDEQARANVAAQVQRIFAATKQRVEQRLARIDGEVNQLFDQSAAAAKEEFESYVDGRMRAYKDERYSGILGGLRWLKDQFLGMPAEVNVFYEEGKQRYLAHMDKGLDRIASAVEMGLAEAKAEVGRGKQEVGKYVASLPTNLKQAGQEAQQQIQSQFDTLEHSIRDKHDQLIDTLAQKYSDSVKQLDDRIGELKAQNQGLIDKAKALITGVIQTIKQLYDMLMGVLARCAAIIGKILEDPIGFVGNLVAGAKAGFQKFVANIGKHLQTGLIGWLTGQLGAAGITMPESFDLKGIFSLVTQVLGLTWQNIRARAVNILGEKTVAVIEKASDIVLLLINGGPAALWEHVQGMVGDLKAAVLDQIRDFVINQIIQAGVTWVLSLFNPASAFIKACKAIYDVIMFFIERAAQIAELINAVLDSVEAVAGGNVAAMADKIDGALSRALPVAISFLASLLGLNGISEKIKNILQKVRAPIESAIDWVLKKAVDLVKKAGKWVGDKVGGSAKDAKKQDGSEDTRTSEEKEEALTAALDSAKAKVEAAGDKAGEDEFRGEFAKIKAQYGLKVLELVQSGNNWGIHGQVNPQKTVVTNNPISKNPLTQSEEAILKTLPGGPELIAKLANSSTQKRESLFEEARVAIAAHQRGDKVEYVGRDIPRTNGNGNLTEIDVETQTEIIQVKGGNYANAKKLTDEDMQQFNNTKIYNEQMRKDASGKKLPPKKIIFHFSHGPVDARLIDWIQKKGAEVRIGL